MLTKIIVVNGVPRQVFVVKDAVLSSVLREQLHLTSVKVGCGQGQCGACSVIMDGKVVRSCITKMHRVPDNAAITTLEGIGTPQNLHPCSRPGFTTGPPSAVLHPGFIVLPKGF
jgi:aldehyde dehydrogenase, molybdenum-binding subunit apoprotein